MVLRHLKCFGLGYNPTPATKAYSFTTTKITLTKKNDLCGCSFLVKMLPLKKDLFPVDGGV
jgi:hypothetical protein